jgi:hypothetical protein
MGAKWLTQLSEILKLLRAEIQLRRLKRIPDGVQHFFQLAAEHFLLVRFDYV